MNKKNRVNLSHLVLEILTKFDEFSKRVNYLIIQALLLSTLGQDTFGADYE